MSSKKLVRRKGFTDNDSLIRMLLLHNILMLLKALNYQTFQILHVLWIVILFDTVAQKKDVNS